MSKMCFLKMKGNNQLNAFKEVLMSQMPVKPEVTLKLVKSMVS